MPPKNRFVTCEICGDRASRKNDEKRKFMAKFPLDEDRCKQWVKNVGKEDLIYVPIEELHELKYICGEHFDYKHFNAKKMMVYFFEYFKYSIFNIYILKIFKDLPHYFSSISSMLVCFIKLDHFGSFQF